MPFEQWKADFSKPNLSRFISPQEINPNEKRYILTLDKDAICLKMNKNNFFAWVDIGTYRYSDFSLSAEIDFSQKKDRCSAGFLFRKIDDTTFFYILVADNGDARLDLVFNGEPRTIIPWTPCPWADGTESIVLDIVAHGTHIIAMVNGRLALETEDDSLELGTMAFAAQTYKSTESIYLSSLTLESRPMEIEVDYMRFIRIAELDVEQRRRIASSLFATENYLPALVHLGKIEKQNKATPEDYFLEAECYLRMDMLPDAQSRLNKCLELKPDMAEAIEEKYNLLYLLNKNEQLKTELENDASLIESNSRLANLLGHAAFNLGNWDLAICAYKKASDLDPEMPIYKQNLANAYEKKGDAVAASAAMLEAAKAYYKEGAWEDALYCSSILRASGYDKNVLDSMDGMIYYASGDIKTAKKLLGKVYRKNQKDAAPAYIYALIISDENRKEAALAFEQALNAEPDVAIYNYRYAECLFINFEQGLETDSKKVLAAINKAIEVSPLDAWSWNLSGKAKIALSNKTPELLREAENDFSKAINLLPSEADPVINLSHTFELEKKYDEAIDVLFDAIKNNKIDSNNGAVLNQMGNIFAAKAQWKEAAEAYSKAYKNASSKNLEADYRTNLAAVLIKASLFAEAEEELRKALEIKETPDAFALMGDVALEFGEAGRAEVAYRAAIELASNNSAILSRLANYYIWRQKFDNAKQVIEKIKFIDKEEAERLQKVVLDATTETINCASCGKKWTVAKNLSETKKQSLYGIPPDDAPAGSCPKCGKVYCVACRKDELVDKKPICPDCRLPLNLQNNKVRYLVYKYLENE